MVTNSNFRRIFCWRWILNRNFVQKSSISTSTIKQNLVLPKTYEAKYQLIDYLKDHVIFKNNDFIVCLKPYGVQNEPVRHKGHELEYDEEENDSSSNDEPLDDELRMDTVVPLLSEALQEPELVLAKSVPRACAGPIIFARNADACQRIHLAHKTANAGRVPFIKLLCICVGTPDPMHDELELHLEKELVNDTKIFVVGSGNYSKRQIMLQRCRRFPFRYKTLATSGDLSLVEVHTLNFSWHNYRLLLMSKGAPILGDDLYQQRVARILGKTILVDPKSANRRNQYIPVDFLKSAGLSLRDYYSLPIYGVVHEMLLINALRVKSEKHKNQMLKANLFLKCPLPNFFGSMLKFLFPDLRNSFDYE